MKQAKFATVSARGRRQTEDADVSKAAKGLPIGRLRTLINKPPAHPDMAGKRPFLYASLNTVDSVSQLLPHDGIHIKRSVSRIAQASRNYGRAQGAAAGVLAGTGSSALVTHARGKANKNRGALVLKRDEVEKGLKLGLIKPKAKIAAKPFAGGRDDFYDNPLPSKAPRMRRRTAAKVTATSQRFAAAGRDDFYDEPLSRIGKRDEVEKGLGKDLSAAWKRGSGNKVLRRDLKAAGVDPRKLRKVTKRERAYDAHDARQRRLGGMTATSGILGAGLLGAAGKDSVRSTRGLHSMISDVSAKGNNAGENAKAAAAHLGKTPSKGKIRPKLSVAVSGKGALLGLGGLAALGTSSQLGRYGRSESNRRHL